MFVFQMTSSTKEPKLLVVAGCLRGITALMVNFTKTMEEGGMFASIYFKFMTKSSVFKTALLLVCVCVFDFQTRQHLRTFFSMS